MDDNIQQPQAEEERRRQEEDARQSAQDKINAYADAMSRRDRDWSNPANWRPSGDLTVYGASLHAEERALSRQIAASRSKAPTAEKNWKGD